MLDLTNIKKIHFSGIAGIGMSAAAGLAKAKGFEVSGSDAHVYEPAKSVLESFGVRWSAEYDNKLGGVDLLVATAALDPKNPEISAARAKRIPIIGFAELLGQLASDKQRIVVVGTHGKGTTSGLIAFVLMRLERDSFFVGGVLNNFKTNFHYGPGPRFVLEGDEYKSMADDPTPKFEFYRPDLLLINNLEFDHPDVYPTLERMKDAFRSLLAKMPETGTVVYNADDANVVEVLASAPAQVRKIGFGFSGQAPISSRRPQREGNLFQLDIVDRSDEVYHARRSFELQTAFPGMPYAYDVLGAVAVLRALDIAPEKFAPLVKEYTGLKRRYEIIYDSGITVIDDYAHHPTAVRQTLEATREKYPDRRIVCFFEPHTFSRTKETLPELQQAFGAADQVYLAEVYPAREPRLPESITGKDVVAAIAKSQRNVTYVRDRQDAIDVYAKAMQPGDVVVVMAVGSFNTLVKDIVALAQRQYAKI